MERSEAILAQHEAEAAAKAVRIKAAFAAAPPELVEAYNQQEAVWMESGGKRAKRIGYRLRRKLDRIMDFAPLA